MRRLALLVVGALGCGDGATGPRPIAGNYAIRDVQFTQAVQASDGSVPIILNGKPAVVNVLLDSEDPVPSGMRIVLREYDAHGALQRADTTRTRRRDAGAGSLLAPDAQFLIGAARLVAAGRWEVVRDPTGMDPDPEASDDRFPREGAPPLRPARVALPAHRVRLVPIRLPGGVVAEMTDQIPAQFMSAILRLLPVGDVSVTIGAPVDVTASFGTTSQAGASTFWSLALAELDLARLTATGVDPETYWYGIVQPPPGTSSTVFGGYSYRPLTPGTGPGTRTSMSVAPAWFTDEGHGVRLFAHEMGHALGRMHAPCGGAQPPIDPGYPFATGITGSVGHDVTLLASGFSDVAEAKSPASGDIMGYCPNAWVSEYTYRGVLAFQLPVAVAVRASSPEPEPVRESVLALRGWIETDGSVRLLPPQAVNAVPTVASRTSSTIVALDRDGRSLFSAPVELLEVDHDVRRHFVALVPGAAARAATVHAARLGPTSAAPR